MSAEMKRFYIAANRIVGKEGRAHWIVEYAVGDPERGGRRKRQNMFLRSEKGERLFRRGASEVFEIWDE
jgi:hypothetical protein